MAVHVLYNANARGGRIRRLKVRIRTLLDAHLGSYHWLETRTEEEAEAAAAAAGPDDLVVAVGGDGTVHRAAQGIAHSGFLAHLGILPVGTGNDFAFAVGLPESLEDCVRLIASGKRRNVDVGEVLLDGQGPYHFVNALGMGFDAAASVASRKWKFLPGVARYLASVLHTLAVWESPESTVGEWTGRMMFATIGNGPRSGGGFLITPDARTDDGRLDLCVVRDLPVGRAVRVIPDVMKGRHRRFPEVHLAQGTEFRVEIARATVPVHLDGEIISTAVRTAEARILPARLRVCAPA